MQKVQDRPFRVAGRDWMLSRAAIEASVGGVEPDAIRDHFVVVVGRRYALKQVLALATGLDRADFTTGQARSILRRLGLATGRLQGRAGDVIPIAAPSRGSAESADLVAEADELRPYRGQWVAMEGHHVVASGETPQEVLSWLRRHNRRVTGGMFRVPVDPTIDLGGFAP